MADAQVRFKAHEADGHYTVVGQKEHQLLGTIVKLPDGNWRAYDVEGNELPGGEAFATRDDAGEALYDHHTEVR